MFVGCGQNMRVRQNVQIRHRNWSSASGEVVFCAGRNGVPRRAEWRLSSPAPARLKKHYTPRPVAIAKLRDPDAVDSDLYLQMRGITKRFPGVVANDDVDFALRRGEIHGLLGENGAGKSTLMKALYGLYEPDAGEIRIEGDPVAFDAPQDAIARGIGMVHQHFMLIPRLSVTKNVVLGVREPAAWARSGESAGGSGSLAPGSIREWLAGLFERMSLDAEADLRWEEGRPQVDISGPDADHLLGRGKLGPKAIEGIETLLQSVFSRDDAASDIYVDVDGARAARKDMLRDIAVEMADKAVDLGEKWTVSGLNSTERRIIHRKLRDYDGIDTESVGDGIFRRLTIDPT